MYRFKSKADGDLIMMAPVGDQLLRIIGREPAAKGIIELAVLPQAIAALEEANSYPDGVEGLDLAIYARDNQLTAQARVRELGDQLEKVVADDLWPLPKYSEILFIK